MSGVGMVVSWCFVDWIVSRTNWVIWGQTRGVLVLQMIMPILAGYSSWPVMSILRSVCGFDGWMKMDKILWRFDVWQIVGDKMIEVQWVSGERENTGYTCSALYY